MLEGAGRTKKIQLKRYHFTSTNFTAKRAEGTIWYRFLGLGYNKIAT